MSDMHHFILSAIQRALLGLDTVGKKGKSLLQPTIAQALQTGELLADQEDTKSFLAPGMYPWRSKDTLLPEPTTGRRRIDIVVYYKK